LCKHCETTGKHSEHVVIRFIGGQVHFYYFIILCPHHH
jgi:hypothetical protein